MELLLIRHAEPRRVSDAGVADPGLTETGVKQAERLASYLAEGSPSQVTAVYSSTQRRAVETALRVADRLGVAPTQDPDLLEFDHGATFYTPVEEYTGDKAAQWEGIAAGRWGDHAFDLPAFRTRVHAAMERIIAAHPSATVAIICHGGVINSYLGEVIGASGPMFFAPGYTSITRVAASRSGHRQMLSANETWHLDRPTAVPGASPRRRAARA
jgi:probable phosphoglycerate mutase